MCRVWVRGVLCCNVGEGERRGGGGLVEGGGFGGSGDVEGCGDVVVV